LDVGERAACLGAAASERARRLASLEAPDFTLPDVDGRPHTLSGFRGKKVLLVAWASW
jgi:cytochrome oxidase Cu insertion factor (SCO1/SenC/PrrC family)